MTDAVRRQRTGSWVFRHAHDVTTILCPRMRRPFVRTASSHRDTGGPTHSIPAVAKGTNGQGDETACTPHRRLAALTPLAAVALVALALATIPYGAPVPSWYAWTMVAAGAVTVALVLSDSTSRWRTLVWWPVAVILAAWALSISTCQFPAEVLTRCWGMALYASLFFAAQISCWSERGRRMLVLAVIAVLATIALDLYWQIDTWRSLVREVRAPVIFWRGKWSFSQQSGSLGNMNDQAVVGVLAPLALITLPTAWSWVLVAFASACAGYVALVGASRQLLIGLCAGAGIASSLRIGRRRGLWIAGGIMLAVAAIALAHPGTRARIMEVAVRPLGDRGVPMAYGLSLAAKNPCLGIGPTLYGHYHTQGIREGWTFAGEPLPQYAMPWVHSLPIEIACELGAVGVVAYGAVLWAFTRRVRQAILRTGPARNLGIAVAASAAAMAAMALIDLTFVKDWVRICWWLVLGLGFASPAIPVGAAVECVRSTGDPAPSSDRPGSCDTPSDDRTVGSPASP